MTSTIKQRLRALEKRLDQLATRSMSLWLAAGLDPMGGAHGFLDRRFVPVRDDDEAPRGPSGEVRGDQSLVQQARHLYAYSLHTERRPHETRASDFAHRLFAHLRDEFERGDVFVHERSRDGRMREGRAGSETIQLYAQGFSIFALATYGRVLNVDAARSSALRHFETRYEALHDARSGGYDQRDDGGWLPFVSAPSGTAKCTNTHIHALEMLTALVRALPEQALLERALPEETLPGQAAAGRVRERAWELALLIATRIKQPAGYLHPFFDLEWRPVGSARVSYGHDVETAWLLLDALDALGERTAPSPGAAAVVEAAAIDMVQHALRTGWDPAGGFHDHGVPEGTDEPARVLDHGKIWWAQVEALPGLYRVFRLTRDEDLITRLEQTLDFIESKSWDRELGGYFWGVDADGGALPRGDHKGEFWKTPYHDVRACLLSADWIAEDL